MVRAQFSHCTHPKSACHPEAGLLKLLVNYVLGTPQMRSLDPSCMQAAVLDLPEFETRQQHRGPKWEAQHL